MGKAALPVLLEYVGRRSSCVGVDTSWERALTEARRLRPHPAKVFLRLGETDSPGLPRSCSSLGRFSLRWVPNSSTSRLSLSSPTAHPPSAASSSQTAERLPSASSRPAPDWASRLSPSTPTCTFFRTGARRTRDGQLTALGPQRRRSSARLPRDPIRLYRLLHPGSLDSGRAFAVPTRRRDRRFGARNRLRRDSSW